MVSEEGEERMSCQSGECLILCQEHGTSVEFEEVNGGFVWGGFWNEFEEVGDHKIITGLIVYEGVSTNGTEFGFEEMKNFAETAIGRPLRFGWDSIKKEHLKGLQYTVGKITSAIVDKAKKGENHS